VSKCPLTRARPSTAFPRDPLPSPPAIGWPRLRCFMQPAALTRPRLRIVLPTALFAPAPFPLHSPFEDVASVLTGHTQLPFGRFIYAREPTHTHPPLLSQLPISHLISAATISLPISGNLTAIATAISR
jgi:hypothetical protein